jgi:hypothetical protein
MAIIGQNALLNQYVPTFYIKDLVDGQMLKYDSTRRAFVNVTASSGSGGGATRLGELEDVSGTVDNPLSLQNGQALVYNSFTSLWQNQFIDYNTLLNRPAIPTNGSFSFIGLSDTATPSLPDGYVKWNSAGTQLVYSTTIPADSITGLAAVATTGDYESLINKPVIGTGSVTSVAVSGGTTGLTTSGGPITTAGTITLSGTLSIANGGTGATTAGAAINALLPSQTGNSGRYLTTNGTGTSWAVIPTGNTGTVTSVSVTSNQGITSLVLDSNTTPSITLGLGDITPASVEAAGTVTGSNLSGINTGDQTIELTGDVTGSGTGSFAATLATVNLTPGVYGDSHFVPTITVNAKGLVTSITTQHVDTSVRDLIEEDLVIQARHQYIVTSLLEVEGMIENNGVIAIL